MPTENTNSDTQMDPEVNYNPESDPVHHLTPVTAVDDLMEAVASIGYTQRNLAISLIWSFSGKYCGTWAQLKGYVDPPEWLESRMAGYLEWISYFSRYVPDSGAFSISAQEMVDFFSNGNQQEFETDLSLLKANSEAFGITIAEAKKAMHLSHQEMVQRQATQKKAIVAGKTTLVRVLTDALVSEQHLEEVNIFDVLAVLVKALDKLPIYQDRLFARANRTRNPVRMRDYQAQHKLLGEVIDHVDTQYCSLEDSAEQNPPISGSGVH